ncbi:hypothetical protein NEHOM01_0314 [Nematocida homosporus]|uniref:uncharacterized protein n=1 Tax=Nematocida homosporus TaxID=1912981 RepID=UPI00221F06B7|nr:uncharacterized protein NEHOM01_0314 [Nematocida homosporus]KAI5184639.1 hypothetical protein NEHOM01_0314 [Nematocida homosporus]
MVNVAQCVLHACNIGKERRDYLKKQSFFVYLFIWCMSTMKNAHLYILMYTKQVAFQSKPNDTFLAPNSLMCFLVQLLFSVYSLYIMLMWGTRFVIHYRKRFAAGGIGPFLCFTSTVGSAIKNWFLKLLQECLTGIVLGILLAQLPPHHFVGKGLLFILYSFLLAAKISNFKTLIKRCAKATDQDEKMGYIIVLIKNTISTYLLFLVMILLFTITDHRPVFPSATFEAKFQYTGDPSDFKGQ